VTGVEPARLFKYVTIDTLTRTLTSTSRHILRELNRSIGILCLSRDGRAEDIHAFIARLAAEAETIAPRGRGVSLTAARRRKRVVPTSRGTP
jgi:hypothetical protein